MHPKHAQANIKDNKKYAEIDIAELLSGKGRPDMLKAIKG